MKIVINRAKCRKCGDILVSQDEHYVYCSCNAIAVAGGDKEILRLGHYNDIIEMSEKSYD